MATDIVCPMYARVDQMVWLANMKDHRPVVLCEYSHSMGNSTGNIFKYWDAINSHPHIQAGASSPPHHQYSAPSPPLLGRSCLMMQDLLMMMIDDGHRSWLAIHCHQGRRREVAVTAFDWFVLGLKPMSLQSSSYIVMCPSAMGIIVYEPGKAASGHGTY